MCGIWGLISKTHGLVQDEEDFINNMTVMGSLRGAHGTGTYWVDKAYKIDWLKVGSDPFTFYASKEYSPYWERAKKEAKCYVGHNRFATKGGIGTDQAHPFSIDGITLVHNGTIHKGLEEYYNKKVIVDSHALTIGLAKEGPEIFSKIEGAFACIWYDEKNKTINIARNHERPMSLMKDTWGYYFASESGMLLHAYHRGKYNKKLESLEVKTNTLYKFHLDAFGEPEVSPLPASKKYFTVSPPYTSQYTDQYGKPKQKQSNTVVFNIIETITDITKDGIILYDHLCLTSINEPCWFRAAEEFDTTVPYEGTLTGPVLLGKYTTKWTNDTSPWYRIKTQSIKEKLEADISKEMDVAMRVGCINCNVEFKTEEDVKDTELLTISSERYRLLCKKCVPNYKYK